MSKAIHTSIACGDYDRWVGGTCDHCVKQTMCYRLKIFFTLIKELKTEEMSIQFECDDYLEDPERPEPHWDDDDFDDQIPF